MQKAVFTSLHSSGPWQSLMLAIQNKKTPCGIFGLSPSQKSYISCALKKESENSLLIIVPDHVRATTIKKDITGLDDDIQCLEFPSRPIRLGEFRALSKEDELERINILGKLLNGFNGVIIATIESIITPLPPVNVFNDSTIKIKLGDEISLNDVVEKLTYIGYRREDRVESIGQFSKRGDILDICHVGNEHALRIEFFGDEVDSIRLFDPLTQRSIEQVERAKILPAVETPLDKRAMERGIRHMVEEAKHLDERYKKKSPIAGFHEVAHGRTIKDFVRVRAERLLEQGTFEGIENFITSFYPSQNTIFAYMNNPMVIFEEPARSRTRNIALMDEFTVMHEESAMKKTVLPSQGNLLYSFDDIIHETKNAINITMQDMISDDEMDIKTIIRFNGKEVPVYKGRFNMLKNDIVRWKKMSYQVLMFAGTEKRAKRLEESLDDFDIHIPVISKDRYLNVKECAIVPCFLTKGFECDDLKLAIISEYELFGASRSRRTRRPTREKGQEIFNDLVIGDYVVHESQGIGKYEGVVNMLAGSFTRDYMKISYYGEDVLYVPVEQMERIQKYIGKDGAKPRINKLGGKQWQKAKAKVKKAVDDMTEELVELYAARSDAKGFEFAEDSEWEIEFGDSFEYEETEDQLACIHEIKQDMQSTKVMDRLLCGDVGYGKTEVALRAIFKAIMNKKQAAILCPTTILAHQHFETMGKRFGDFPIERAELSRFLSKKEQDKVVRQLANGTKDVVVGTHRLLSQDIKFKDLGLLVIDEEQRFGVAHKEKIKQLKEKVDVLTLTATPIPRTLHMSLSGIRDISVLDTPPEERHPVQTYVVEYDEDMVRGAILREIGRDGKVFFLYNRVASIDSMARRLADLVPECKIGIAHGQMNEHKLEDTMIKFMEGEYNVLLCTTIIESGLDIPTANTLIVCDADRFGLSQLYQLRGRVGRSNRLAYAYLTWRGGKVLSETAEKRLTAISQFTEFGSGLKIAMRDLEIRGAGDILGANQHGHMSVVGYGMYCKIISNAIRKIKGETPPENETDVTLNLQLDASIPIDYIQDTQDRLDIYRKMSLVASSYDKSDILDELIDRFGDPPKCVENLLDVAHIKSLAQKASIEMIKQSGSIFTMRFATESKIDGLKLFDLVQTYGNMLKLSNNDFMMLKYSGTTSRVDELFTLLQQVADCKSVVDLV